MGPRSSRTVYDGRLIRVEVETWADPLRRREIVRHPGAAAVLALDGTDRAILVRQLREAVRAPLLEVPAGILDVAGERPEDTARRELEEETGYRCVTLEPLGRIHSSPGFSDEAIELFLARAEPAGPAEEGIEVVPMPIREAVSAVEDGRITDAKTVAAVLLGARRRPGPGGSPSGLSRSG